MKNRKDLKWCHQNLRDFHHEGREELEGKKKEKIFFTMKDMKILKKAFF